MYWQQECELQEYELQFMQQLSERLIPRLVNRFGADFQDYMIAREITAQLPEPPQPKPRVLTIHQSQAQPQTYYFNREEEDEEPRNLGYSDEEVARRTEAILAKRRAAKREQERREQARQAWEAEQQRQKEKKAFPYGKPAAQAPNIIKPNRYPSIPLLSFNDDEDVIDADYSEVVDNEASSGDRYFSGAGGAGRTAQRTAASSNKGGRPKKYSNAAERQAAYRARKRAAA